MNQTNHAHMQALRQKHDNFYNAFANHNLSPHGALHLYKTVYYTEINFSIPSTSLPTYDIKTLTSKIITSLLRKMKLPSTFPRALVYSLHSRLALDVTDIEFAQGYSKVEKTITHIPIKNNN